MAAVNEPSGPGIAPPNVQARATELVADRARKIAFERTPDDTADLLTEVGRAVVAKGALDAASAALGALLTAQAGSPNRDPAAWTRASDTAKVATVVLAEFADHLRIVWG